MKFYDFIGNELTIGCYCAHPGRGNIGAEYGMILYKVIGFDEEKQKVKAIRIFSAYGRGEKRDWFARSEEKNAIFSYAQFDTKVKIAINSSVSSIENTNKLAIVFPSERIKSMFDKIIAMDDSVFNDIAAEDILNWLHGSSHTLHNKRRIWD